MVEHVMTISMNSTVHVLVDMREHSVKQFDIGLIDGFKDEEIQDGFCTKKVVLL